MFKHLVRFDYSARELLDTRWIQDRCGVYAVFIENKCIYVGCAKVVRLRLCRFFVRGFTMKDNSKRCREMIRNNGILQMEIVVEVFPEYDYIKLGKLEARWIKRLKPSCNLLPGCYHKIMKRRERNRAKAMLNNAVK